MPLLALSYAGHATFYTWLEDNLGDMQTLIEPVHTPRSWQAAWLVFRTSNRTVPAILFLALGLRFAVVMFFPNTL